MVRAMDYFRQYEKEPLGIYKIDMRYQIHSLEKEAYGSVLRAFIAQSAHLSWDKERFITQLRRELNVTDAEHCELLMKINSDELIKIIRECQNGATDVQYSLSGDLNPFEFAPNPVGHSLQKKRKTTHSSDSILHKQEPYGQVSARSHLYPIPAPSKDTGKGILKSIAEIGYDSRPCVDHLKKRIDVIQIHETEKLLHMIERLIYGRKGIDPAIVEKAKSILSAQERSLLWALAVLSDVSDDDGSPDQMLHHHSNGEVRESTRHVLTRSNFHQQAGRSNSYPPESYLPKENSLPKSYLSTHLVKMKARHPDALHVEDTS